MKYRKKPIVIDAICWMKMGDDSDVHQYVVALDVKCDACLEEFKTHGQIKTLEGEHIVCPGDWIITGIKGERYPCKPDIFEMTYERAE